MYLLSIVLLFTYLAHAASCDVIAGPIVNPANGHEYYLLSRNAWFASQGEASVLGGNLVTINNEAENEWVYSTFANYEGVARGLWIGLNDVMSEGNFVWVSGEPVTYTNWATGEPNNSPGEEDFAHIGSPRFRGPRWNDRDGLSFKSSSGRWGVVEVVPNNHVGEPERPTASDVRSNLIIETAESRSLTRTSARGQSGTVDLLSAAGERYVGDQLEAFSVDPNGVISSSKPAWIMLYYTENKPFRLSGEVWLGGRSDTLLHPKDLPDGFALFLREWGGKQRYGLTSRGTRVKRRLYSGERQSQIANVARFDEKRLGRWIPFKVTANWDAITFSFGEETVTVDGPLDMDGANKIVVAPGTKLRHLRLGVFRHE